MHVHRYYIAICDYNTFTTYEESPGSLKYVQGLRAVGGAGGCGILSVQHGFHDARHVIIRHRTCVSQLVVGGRWISWRKDYFRCLQFCGGGAGAG